jgi:phospholipid/cholesterol/gamma-HCH transport system substrate-binding protein
MRPGAEIKVGIITLIAIILVGAYLFYVRGYIAAAATYQVCVTFESARGLEPGDPVRMVGVRIGKVDSVEINPDLKADVTLAIDERYDLYDNYKFQIAASGIIPERFVEVLPAPADPYATKMGDGFCVDGVVQPTLRDISDEGHKLLASLNRTSRALNVVLTDQEILMGLRSALQAFSAAAADASELATTTAALADESRPEIMAALRHLEGASADLRAVTAEVRSQLTEGGTLADVEETMHYARRAAANAAEATAVLAELAGDQEIQDQLREAVSAVHAAAMSAKQVGQDVEVLSGELRAAAPSVAKVASEAEKIAGAAESVRQSLEPPEITATFDVIYSGKADRWFPTGSLDFHTRPNRFFRLGIDDIGEGNEFNAQLGDRHERFGVRYGLVRSRLGFGVDFPLPRRSSISLDIFDPNNVRADIYADIPILPDRANWSILLGARDIGEEDLLVGGIRLER